jgi:hypothetical protein
VLSAACGNPSRNAPSRLLRLDGHPSSAGSVRAGLGRVGEVAGAGQKFGAVAVVRTAVLLVAGALAGW